VVAAVDVNDIEAVDFVEVVLGGPGGEDVGGAGVKAGTEQRHQTGFFKLFPIRPLPAVFKCGGLKGFVVGGVQGVDTGFQTGVHDMESLVGQGDIDNQGGFFRFQQRGKLRHVVGIHLGGANGATLHFFNLFSNGHTFVFAAAGEEDVAENLGQLGAFVGNHTADTAGANNNDF